MNLPAVERARADAAESEAESRNFDTADGIFSL